MGHVGVKHVAPMPAKGGSQYAQTSFIWNHLSALWCARRQGHRPIRGVSGRLPSVRRLRPDVGFCGVGESVEAQGAGPDA